VGGAPAAAAGVLLLLPLTFDISEDWKNKNGV